MVTEVPRESSSPLRVRDVILSMNGIRLKDVEGGLESWVRLFVAFGSGPRNLAVARRIDGVDDDDDIVPAVVTPGGGGAASAVRSKPSIAARGGHRNDDDGADGSGASSAVREVKMAHNAVFRKLRDAGGRNGGTGGWSPVLLGAAADALVAAASAAKSDPSSTSSSSWSTYKSGIMDAITRMKDRTGSSSVAIKKYMLANIPDNRTTLINHMFLGQLKKMVADGILVRFKDHYKISADYKEYVKKLERARRRGAVGKMRGADITEDKIDGKKEKPPLLQAKQVSIGGGVKNDSIPPSSSSSRTTYGSGIMMTQEERRAQILTYLARRVRHDGSGKLKDGTMNAAAEEFKCTYQIIWQVWNKNRNAILNPDKVGRKNGSGNQPSSTSTKSSVVVAGKRKESGSAENTADGLPRASATTDAISIQRRNDLFRFRQLSRLEKRENSDFAIASRPPPAAATFVTAVVSKPFKDYKLGILIRQEEVEGGGSLVRVMSIAPNSLVDYTDLRAGMVLVSINGEKCVAVEQALASLRAAEGRLTIVAAAANVVVPTNRQHVPLPTKASPPDATVPALLVASSVAAETERRGEVASSSVGFPVKTPMKNEVMLMAAQAPRSSNKHPPHIVPERPTEEIAANMSYTVTKKGNTLKPSTKHNKGNPIALSNAKSFTPAAVEVVGN